MKKTNEKVYMIVINQKRRQFSLNFNCEIVVFTVIDEVVLDMIPHAIYGMMLGSPYLFDRKSIFFREHNMYHFFKNGIKYIVRAHKMKNGLSMIATGQMKMLVNASKCLCFMTNKGCGLRNELVSVDTTQMLQDTPHKQHGELKPENILDCRERDPLVLTDSVKRNKISFPICMFNFMFTFVTIQLCLDGSCDIEYKFV